MTSRITAGHPMTIANKRRRLGSCRLEYGPQSLRRASRRGVIIGPTAGSKAKTAKRTEHMLPMLQDAWSDPGASSVGFELQEGGIAILFVVRIAAIVKGDGIGPSRGRENGWRICSISGTQSHLPPASLSPSLIHGWPHSLLIQAALY